MRSSPSQLIGINVKELSRICHVSLKTATRWKDGTTCPPESALLLLAADLGCFDAAWKGWTVRRGHLISPEGWSITLGDVISSPLLRQQLAAFKTELKRLRAAAAAEESIHDQPVPEVWPEWIFDKLA